MIPSTNDLHAQFGPSAPPIAIGGHMAMRKAENSNSH
jgi:hypothetical protein